MPTGLIRPSATHYEETGENEWTDLSAWAETGAILGSIINQVNVTFEHVTFEQLERLFSVLLTPLQEVVAQLCAPEDSVVS